MLPTSAQPSALTTKHGLGTQPACGGIQNSPILKHERLGCRSTWFSRPRSRHKALILPVLMRRGSRSFQDQLVLIETLSIINRADSKAVQLLVPWGPGSVPGRSGDYVGAFQFHHQGICESPLWRAFSCLDRASWRPPRIGLSSL